MPRPSLSTLQAVAEGVGHEVDAGENVTVRLPLRTSGAVARLLGVSQQAVAQMAAKGDVRPTVCDTNGVALFDAFAVFEMLGERIKEEMRLQGRHYPRRPRQRTIDGGLVGV